MFTDTRSTGQRYWRDRNNVIDSKNMQKQCADHAKRRAYIRTMIAAPRGRRVQVPSRVRGRVHEFFFAPALHVDEATRPFLDDDTCARTQPESLSGWSQKNHVSDG
jgi:hypothetical protein